VCPQAQFEEIKKKAEEGDAEAQNKVSASGKSNCSRLAKFVHVIS
jgi:hypothetical protein